MTLLARPPSARARRRPRAAYPPLLLVAAVAVALLTLVPLGFIVGYTISTGWAETVRLVVRPRTAELLWNTARLTAGCVLACAAIGTGAAWLLERIVAARAPGLDGAAGRPAGGARVRQQLRLGVDHQRRRPGTPARC